VMLWRHDLSMQVLSYRNYRKIALPLPTIPPRSPEDSKQPELRFLTLPSEEISEVKLALQYIVALRTLPPSTGERGGQRLSSLRTPTELRQAYSYLSGGEEATTILVRLVARCKRLGRFTGAK
jgi:hypothetical protein